LKILCADMCGMNSDRIYLIACAALSRRSPALQNDAITLWRHFRDHGIVRRRGILKLVEKHGITQSQLVPTMFVRMLKLRKKCGCATTSPR